MKRIIFALVRLYQKYISAFTPASCRYYPTCSQYALDQLENNSVFKAIYFTITRILKCNQLFDGGFDYPIIKMYKKKNIKFKKIKIIYWLVPINHDRFLVIKNREWKEKKK
ncbi:MAG: membrane protein insertion efficiency factor YidD [Campylobacterales bacterium]|nr:membrane protein insertion efficiency factor YidD [Campylobacterales bacterium]NQY53117.1 membrane protein insertion efficiency factor YidD [Campylobacteraceae bacterium]